MEKVWRVIETGALLGTLLTAAFLLGMALSAIAYPAKLPHHVPVPYSMEEYWEGVEGALPTPVAGWVRE